MENEDVTTLLKDVFEELDCTREFEFINIYEGKRGKRHYGWSHPALEIPNNVSRPWNSFGYWNKDTPSKIESMGIGEIMCEDWYLGVYSANYKEILEFVSNKSLQISKQLTEKGLLKNQIVIAAPDVEWDNTLPLHRYTLKININALKEWLEKRKTLQRGEPIFDEATGTFIYGSEHVPFKVNGKEAKSLNFLVKNFCSIVSKKSLYEVCGQPYSRNPKKENSVLEDRFRSIRERLQNNSTLKRRLVFVQKEGFGIFENRKPELLE